MEQYRPGKFGMLTPVVKNLLIINVIFFVATYAVLNAFNYDLTKDLALYFFGSDLFRPYQFITHMFMHGSLGHIFFNMFALWMFGKTIESVWGPKRFLIYYLVTGLGAAALHTLVNWYSISDLQQGAQEFFNNPAPEMFVAFLREYFPEVSINPQYIDAWLALPDSSHYISESTNLVNELILTKTNIPTVGASGAVFGLLLAFGMLFPNSMIYVYFAIPIKAKYFVMIYGAIELYAGVMNQPGDNIAHFAHLGGMIFGYFLILYWKKKQFKRWN
ncbi:MAG: rhomboid family intramembrane serine protease [Bacteroidota bacterium]